MPSEYGLGFPGFRVGLKVWGFRVFRLSIVCGFEGPSFRGIFGCGPFIGLQRVRLPNPSMNIPYVVAGMLNERMVVRVVLFPM